MDIVQARIRISTIGCIRCTHPFRRSTSDSPRSARGRKRRPIVCPGKSGVARGTATVGDGTNAGTRRLRREYLKSAPASLRTVLYIRGLNLPITMDRDTVSREIADPWMLTATRLWDISLGEVSVLSPFCR